MEWENFWRVLNCADQLRYTKGMHDPAWHQEFEKFQQAHNQPLAPQEIEAFERAFEEAKQGTYSCFFISP